MTRKMIESRLFTANERLKPFTVHNRFHTGATSQFAMEIMKLTSVAAPEIDGVQVLLTPEQVVARSVDIAERAFTKFAELGWVIETPEFDEMIESSSPAGFGSGA